MIKLYFLKTDDSSLIFKPISDKGSKTIRYKDKQHYCKECCRSDGKHERYCSRYNVFDFNDFIHPSSSKSGNKSQR